METAWRLLKKFKIELRDQAIPFLSISAKKTETLTQKDICIPMFTAASLKIAKIWKQTKCLLMDK